MDLASIGMYLAANGSAMIAGLIVWWTIENMQPLRHPRTMPSNIVWVMILGLFLTPLGAWVVSAVIRSRRLAADLKAGGD
jgi:cytochrome c oxidase assembly factor CtaG